MHRLSSLGIWSLLLIALFIVHPLCAIELTSSDWTMTQGTLAEVESLFTRAHRLESLPPFSLPSDETWSKKSDAEKMLFIINSEREVRGLRALRGISKRINDVSQSYAQKLLESEHLTHRLDGKNSWMRLHSVPEIASCMNRIDYAENLAMFGSLQGYQKFYIERAAFAWMYDDEQHDWRHRSMLLYDDLSTNGSDRYANALIGVGIANTRRESGYYVIYVVLNYVDPCPSWAEE